jgi:undecaprenyl-diphosphatase
MAFCRCTRFGTRISFDDKIEAVLGNQIAISSVLVLGGVVLFVDKWFQTQLSLMKRHFYQKQLPLVLAMPCMHARNISICGHWRNDSRIKQKSGSRIFFFLAVPTMLAVTVYLCL